MLIMNRHRVVKEKISRLTSGYSAYAETYELIRLIKREVSKQNLNVVYDEADSGCWFIPLYRT